MSEVISFNPEELTIGEMEDFEEMAGMSWSAAFKEKIEADGTKTVDFPAKALAAIVCVVKRHDNPKFSYEDARNTKVSALKIETADVPPTKESSAEKS